MMLKINKQKMLDFVIQAFLIVLLCEKIYNGSYISGKYNSIVTIMVTLFSILLLFTKKCNLFKNDFWVIGFIVIVLAYGFSIETIRYGLVFFALVIWNKLQFENLDFVHIATVILGGFFSILDITRGYDRVSGYNAGSPTQFSCALLISLIYFLFYRSGNRKIRFVFAVLTCLMVVITKSASAIIVMGLILIYKVCMVLLSKTLINERQLKYLVTGAIIITGVFVLVNYNTMLNLIPRSNRMASTSTRLGIYQTFWNILTANMGNFLMGKGGGYTQRYIQAYWGISSYLPVHQDILMFACEYGILGLLGMYFFLFKNFKMNILIWAVLILGSFHNIILAPMSLCLLILTSNTVRMQQGESVRYWR